MEKSDWEKIKFFSFNENWGDASLIKVELVTKLDVFRGLIDTPIFISCGTQGVHAPNSFHYKGEAVDILFPKKSTPDIPLLAKSAMQCGFSGIGLYPHWKLSDREIGGMHLDIRSGKRKMWIGLANIYLPYSEDEVKKYF